MASINEKVEAEMTAHHERVEHDLGESLSNAQKSFSSALGRVHERLDALVKINGKT